MAKAIFVGGTASHVGKSWMTTAICRYLRRRGFTVAPFKAQNMSNNSYPCAAGGEIGRAQVAQAEACGLQPETDMNPVLLKPNSDCGSQVIVNGRVWRNMHAREYFQHTAELKAAAHAAYARLARRFDYVVIEGAGSIAEVNLKSRDFVNLSMAREAGAAGLLVADIDRGGVFAAVAGTLDLLEPEERALIRTFAVNRFRGDRSLFSDGVEFLERRTGCPSLGVFPMLPDAGLHEEDGVAAEESSYDDQASIAVVRLPRISNFTDFRLLCATYVTRPVQKDFEWVILPGTKNTIADLEWLRATGLDQWILRQHAQGANLLGVCGGYQMLGIEIDDPEAAESSTPAAARGLGLLPVRTVLQKEKMVRAVKAQVNGITGGAYEIHVGCTQGTGATLSPFANVEGEPEGAVRERVIGTYLHGVFEHRAIAANVFGENALKPSIDGTYDRLADWFEQNADLRCFQELYL